MRAQVIEYDSEDQATLHISTLDEFEQFLAIYVDMGLGIFSLTTAGIKVGMRASWKWEERSGGGGGERLTPKLLPKLAMFHR